MAAQAKIEPALTAPHKLAYTYKRSLGPVLSRFFTGLRDKQILGVRRADGSVMVPPKEYDPETGEALSELVPVADTGVVTSWAWVHQPARAAAAREALRVRADPARRRRHAAAPRGRRGQRERDAHRHARARALGRARPAGAITDIQAFVPAALARRASESHGAEVPNERTQRSSCCATPIELEYTYSAGQSASRFLRASREGKLLGQSARWTGASTSRSRGSCPQHGVPFTGDTVELTDKGTHRHLLDRARAVGRTSRSSCRTSRCRCCSTAPTRS